MAPPSAAPVPERRLEAAGRSWAQRLIGLLQRRHRRWMVGLAGWLARVMPLHPNRVVFVSKRNVPVTGNLRIVADALAARGGHEIAVYKDGPIPPDTVTALRGRGIRVLEGFSLEAALFIAGSSTVVLSHSARDANLTHRRRGRRIVNLWHGVALKRIELLMSPVDGSKADAARREAMLRNASLYDAVIASSPVDRLVNALAFGVPYQNVHAVGLPRFDYLDPAHALPPDLAAQRERLDARIGTRRLVLFAPTFREAGAPCSELFAPAVLERLRALCRQEQLVFGLRPHPYESRRLESLCDGDVFVNLDPNEYTEAALLLARAEALIVDYSSIWVDFLPRRKTILGYVPDLELYASRDRGFIYDQETLFPGPLLPTGDALVACLQEQARRGFPVADEVRHAIASAQLLPGPREGATYTSACLDRLFGRGEKSS